MFRLRRGIISVFLIPLSLAGTVSVLRAAPEGPSGDLREKATALYRSGDYDGAIKIYRQLVDLHPGDLEHLKDLMWVLWQAKRYNETAAAAARVIEKDPKDIETLKLLGRAQQASGNTAKALETYKRVLALRPDDDSMRQQIAHLDITAWKENGELSDLERVSANLPKQANLYDQLASAQFRQGLYKEAAANWTKAAILSPTKINLQFQAAKALYYSGKPDQALSDMKALVQVNVGYWPAIEFILDDAVSRGDMETAQEIMENNLREFHIEDEPRLIRLATIYMDSGNLDKCLKTLERFLEVNPNSGEAMLLKAEVLIQMNRPQEAIKVYEQIYPLNPWSIRALKGVAEAQSMVNHPELALKSIQKARAIDPTDPYLLVQEGEYLYESGHLSASKQLMLKWMDANTDPVIPILLYHGLTPFSRDPMLAYSINVTEATFAAHMRALKKYGYSPVTAEQVDGWSRWLRRLYHKPVMISFDDARMDSFRYADPVLQQFSLKATMFVPLSNIEQNFPGYANWDILNQYRNTGRWEIQAHGDLGHTDVPIDSEGRKGLFLVNRKWNAQDSRMETILEWQGRAREDHASQKRKFTQHLGFVPVAFAFPEGNFGQDGIPNFPDAASMNLMLVRKAYGTAYHQDEFGLNVRSRDSMLLTRVEPKNSWSGEDLIRHISDHTPTILMIRQLLHHAAWDGKDHEAYDWLEKLRAASVTPAVLLADEAVIRYNEGDYTEAKSLAEKSQTLSPTPEMARLLKNISHKERFDWSPTAVFSEDNNDRQNWVAENNFGFRLFGNTRMNLNQLYGEYQEAGTPDVIDRGAGIGIVQSLGVFHTLQLQYTGHKIDGQKNSYAAGGVLHSRWSDKINTQVSAGRTPYDTARALNEQIFRRFAHVQADWKDSDDIWRGTVKGRAVANTDENNDYQGELQGSYRFFPGVNFRGVYRFMAEDMKFISPAYYSPQSLIVNQLGVEYVSRKSKHFEPYLTYLPGVGSEEPTKADFVQDFEVGLPIHWGETTRFTPSYSMTMTPSYTRRSYGLSFVQLF